MHYLIDKGHASDIEYYKHFVLLVLNVKTSLKNMSF